MAEKRTPQFYTLNQVDKILHVCGAPLSALKANKVSLEKLPFQETNCLIEKTMRSVSSAAQKKFSAALDAQVSSFGRGGIYAVGAYPISLAENQFVLHYARKFINESLNTGILPKFLWIDLAAPPWDFLKENQDVKVCVISNISETSDAKRFEIARDFINAADPATVFICAITKNILNFCVNNLHCMPSGAFQMGVLAHRKIS